MMDARVEAVIARLAAQIVTADLYQAKADEYLELARATRSELRDLTTGSFTDDNTTERETGH